MKIGKADLIHIAMTALALIGPERSFAGDVERACQTPQFKVLALQPRDVKANLQVIKKAELGSSALLRDLAGRLRGKPPGGAAGRLKLVSELNSKYIRASEAKSGFLKFQSEASRLKDPAGYMNAVIENLHRFLPEQERELDDFLTTEDPRVSSFMLRPAGKNEEMSTVGAATMVSPDDRGKTSVEIVISNNESETIPYLLTLIVHELEHAKNYKTKLDLRSDSESTLKSFLEEPVAYEKQMEAYVALARADRDLFCNWIYSSWYLGDLPVPLSWTMATMEKELRSGRFLFWYAKNVYKNNDLLTSNREDLKPEIRAKIRKLNLKYVH